MKLLKRYWWLVVGAAVLFVMVEKLPELPRLPEPVNKINDVVYKFHAWLRKTLFKFFAVLTVPERAGVLQHSHTSGSWGGAK